MMVCAITLFASPAMSATINVTANAADVLNGANASCSLREAITNINDGALTYADCPNTGAAYGTGDTINIPAGTYTTTLAGVEDLNATGDYDINRSVAITGAGASSTTINGGAIDRVLHITAAQTVSISGVTITGGNVAGDTGGGIYNGGTLTLTNSTITSNTATGWWWNNTGIGGGIFNSGTLTVTNSTITSNTVTGHGGGIGNSGTLTVSNSTITSNTSGDGGGGINTWGSTATVTNSTISNNTAQSGGGIYTTQGTVTVTNCTISGNTAVSSGGGISSNVTFTLTNSTIASNTAANGGGGIYVPAGTFTFSNSIVANHSFGQNCVVVPNGQIVSTGYNLESANTCLFASAGDLINTNPLLGALANNGGPTQTMALGIGSPAIDAGSCVQATDQRGYTRVAPCDIGAFEYGAVAPDTTPNAFSFTAQTGVALSTVATSNAITVSGINTASPVSIVGGTYSINGGSYTAAAGTVNNGDTVTVRQTSSASYSTLTTATLTIGGVSGAFDVTTLAVDTTPDPFAFTAQTGVALSTVATSNTITVAGITTVSPISIVGGTYSINGGAYTAAAGTVNSGDTVTLRQTSSASYSTLTTATLTIGGVSGAFNVTTLAAPPPPPEPPPPPPPQVDLAVNGGAGDEVTVANPVAMTYQLRGCWTQEMFLVLNAPAMGIVWSYLNATGAWVALPTPLSPITPWMSSGPADGAYTLFTGSVPVGDYELYLGCDFVTNGHLDHTGGTTINGVYDHIIVHVR